MTPLETVLAVGLFIVGLVLLIFGGDWFVDGATGIAKRLHVPEFIIGATIVSIGTTLPEVMVSSSAAVLGHGQIAYGNAIGSIICNTALIAAVSIAIRPSTVNPKSFRTPIIFFFAAAVFYAANAYIFGGFSRLAGVILLLGFVAYMVVVVLHGRKHPEEAEEETEDAKERKLWQELLLLVGGAAAIAVGARLLVDNGTLIAEVLGVPESVIALTFVALGTSLPELVTAVVSLKKGHGLLSLGNIVGANLFNLVLVSGLSTVLQPYTIPTEKTFLGQNAALLIDTPLMLLVMAILALPALKKGELKRWQGILLLGLYAAYCVFQFAL